MLMHRPGFNTFSRIMIRTKANAYQFNLLHVHYPFFSKVKQA